jgi:hypothetical protein
MKESLLMQREKSVRVEKPGGKGLGDFFRRYRAHIIIAVLVLYVILLMTGTIAEIFHIDSILDWWIWRPVGK